MDDMSWFVLGYQAGKKKGGSPAVIQPITITQNGKYTAPKGVDGYNPVEVKVAGSSGDTRLSKLLGAAELANVPVTDEWSISIRMSDEMNGDQILNTFFDDVRSEKGYQRYIKHYCWCCYCKNGLIRFAFPCDMDSDTISYYTPANGTEYISYNRICSNYGVTITDITKYSSGTCRVKFSFTYSVTQIWYNPDGSISSAKSADATNSDNYLPTPMGDDYSQYTIAITRGDADTYVNDVWDYAQAVHDSTI